MPQARADSLCRVPFVDLRRQHEQLGRQLSSAISEVIGGSTFVGGQPVASFEEAFAQFCGVDHCVGVSSGLDALRLALKSVIDPGDEVIVPGATFVATWEAVVQAGGVLRVVDVDPIDLTLDPSATEAALTSRTRCLLPVHLYGQLADMPRLAALAERRGINIIEDACQAHGAARAGYQAGASGTAAAFSFYPSKNLGALGDGGAVVTQREDLAEHIRELREHGRNSSGEHVRMGYTARLDTLQAALLAHKLRFLPEWNAMRAAAARGYTEQLEGTGDLRLPTPRGVHAWHLYVVRTADPNRLQSFLGTRGIDSRRHYPRPPHLEAAFAGLGLVEGTLPEAERLSREALSLPLFPGITADEIDMTSSAVREFFSGN